jgi:hypothetical protein
MDKDDLDFTMGVTSPNGPAATAAPRGPLVRCDCGGLSKAGGLCAYCHRILNRTDTHGPFVPGQRNVDRLADSTPIAHLCDAYRHQGRVEMVLRFFPTGWERIAREELREMRRHLDLATKAGEPADRIADLERVAVEETANIPELVAAGRRALGIQ